MGADTCTGLLGVALESEEFQRVLGTGGREKEDDWCERVGFLAWRGGSEREVEGEGSGLRFVFVFQSERSRGC
jgi:hypothetical protein